MITPWLLALPFVAAGDWIAHWKNWKVAAFFTKPATLILLIGWSFSVSGWQGNMLPFGLALVFSLAGDVFLMLPGHFFLAGLGAFLLAHLAYLVGFNCTPLTLGLHCAPYAALAVGLSLLMYYLLLRKVAASPHGKKLRLPVLVYSATIIAMLLSSWLTWLRPEWPQAAALLVIAGSGLFFLSDSLLAVNRFLKPLPHGQVGVHFTYHVGQFALTAGALLAFAGRG